MGLITTSDCREAIAKYLQEFLIQHRNGWDNVELAWREYTKPSIWKRVSKSIDANGNTFRTFKASLSCDGEVTVLERHGMIKSVKWRVASGPTIFDFIQPNAGDFDEKPEDNTPKPGNWGSFA